MNSERKFLSSLNQTSFRMNKKLLTLLAAFVITGVSYAQNGYYMLAHTYAPGNPGGINQDQEFPVGGGIAPGWTTIHPGPQAAATYSAAQTIPFTFSFDGTPVTQYKVSSSGVLTFDVAATSVPAYGSVNTADVPAQSAYILGMQGTQANDNIVIKTFGTAPNRQHWVQWSSYSLAPNTACWTYWAIVLEEGTNKIYLVDQRYANCTTTFTIGVKVNGTTTVGPAAAVQPLAGTDAGPATNHYYEFTPGVQAPVAAKMANLGLLPFVFLNANNTVSGRIFNTGAQAITSGSLHYSVNNGTPNTNNLTGLNVASGTMYNFSHSTPLTVTASGNYTVSVWMTNINGSGINTDTITRNVSALSSVLENLIVFEHFTNASCGPCAAQNPGLEAVMNQHKLTATSLKYHVSWPGVDPMYTFNTADPTARVNYYNITGVPSVRIGSSANLAPNQVTSSLIETQSSNIAEAFKYNVSTYIENNTLQVAGTVIATSAQAQNDLRLHVVLVEDPINYATPPGTNGEKDFPMVVRKMFPSAQGTSIGNGSTSTAFNFSYPIPSTMIQDRLHVVLFVQSNATRVAFKGAKIKVGSNLWATSVVEQGMKQAELKLYPNPASNVSNLAIELKQNANVEVSVFNATGQEVLRTNLGQLMAGSHVHSLELSGLAKGMYHVQTRVNDEMGWQRLVIQ